MTDWISGAFKKIGLTSGTKSKPSPSQLPFTDDPCFTCTTPCSEGHAIFPPLKIDQTIQLDTTVKPYVHHFLLSVGEGRTWPERIEDLNDDSLLVRKVYAGAETMAKTSGRAVITACDRELGSDALLGGAHEEGEGTEEVETVTVTTLIHFPSFLAFPGVNVDSLPTLIQDIMDGRDDSDKAVWKNGVKLKGKTLVLVCTHKRRDKRCGVAGPLLIEEIKREVTEKGLDNEVFCYGVSHFGGHKFAGNLIIYSPKFPTGLWEGVQGDI
ncbi:hypothetical protein HDU97_010422 [Phlyctochytrium planicorne]|nr:hypothetical protein HDU97_010422 [Phlyctochytrium planicorne]